MVKRTVVVLGVLSLMCVFAGTSSAIFPVACGPTWDAWDSLYRCAPPFVPAPCCEYPVPKMIVQKWKATIEGPCPPPTPPAPVVCGVFDPGEMLWVCIDRFMGGLDYLMGACDGAVYGCYDPLVPFFGGYW